MERNDWENVIRVMRSAPLNNMAHAEAVDKLIIKVGEHAGLNEPPKPPAELMPAEKLPGVLNDDVG